MPYALAADGAAALEVVRGAGPVLPDDAEDVCEVPLVQQQDLVVAVAVRRAVQPHVLVAGRVVQRQEDVGVRADHEIAAGGDRAAQVDGVLRVEQSAAGQRGLLQAACWNPWEVR